MAHFDRGCFAPPGGRALVPNTVIKEMTLIELNRVWTLFVSDPVAFILMFADRVRMPFASDPVVSTLLCATVVVAVAWLTWWLSRWQSSRVHKRQMAAKDGEISVKSVQVQLALSQRDEVDARLTDAQASNSKLQRQIQTIVNGTEILAIAKSTQTFLNEMKIAIDKVGVTLGSP